MVRTALVWIAKSLLKQVGRELLTKSQTEDYLRPYRIVAHPAHQLVLPKTTSSGPPARPGAPATQAVASPVFVWRYAPWGAKAALLPYGGLVANRKVLCTDANTRDYFRNLWPRRRRPTVRTGTLLAPWSHHLDGFMWGGYYDFVMLVAGKLCRMKDALPAAEFDAALVAYPLFGTAYEQEYLALLGIRPEKVRDSRTASVAFDACVLGNMSSWFYPNPADIQSLRRHVLAQLPSSGPTGQQRIYVSRAGRRRVTNEAELIELLTKYGFTIVPDEPRSVAEQVALYRNASFIIGPHGASFTNILWCLPGAHLFELFSATYVPDFFNYLAQLLGLGYSAYHHGAVPAGNWAEGLNDDLFVSIPELEARLSQLLDRSGT